MRKEKIRKERREGSREIERDGDKRGGGREGGILRVFQYATTVNYLKQKYCHVFIVSVSTQAAR